MTRRHERIPAMVISIERAPRRPDPPGIGAVRSNRSQHATPPRPRLPRSSLQLAVQMRRRWPVGVPVHQCHHVGWLTRYGNLPRPVQQRLSIRFLGERGAVRSHFFVAELAQDRVGQHGFDEQIALEDEVLALGRAEALKDAARLLGPVVPRRLDRGAR